MVDINMPLVTVAKFDAYAVSAVMIPIITKSEMSQKHSEENNT